MKQNIIARSWNFLTATHPSITDIEQRRQSKLLASLIIVVFFTVLVAAGLLMSDNSRGGQMGFIGVSLVVWTILYFVNRAGYYKASAYGFVGLSFLLVHVPPMLGDGEAMVWLMFETLMLVLSATLLSTRATVTLFVLGIALQLGTWAVHPLETVMTNRAPFIVFMTTGALVTIFIIHRNGLEVERQTQLREANKLLTESSVKLTELNDQLEHRVAERTRDLNIAKDEAEAAREQAEKADEIKSQFLASMSHELRTPLNAILNFTEMLSLEMVGPVSEEQKDLLNKSLSSARHLLSLINDVLDVSKMQSGMLALFLEDQIDLNKELNAVAVTAETLLRGKPVTLVADLDANLPRIRGDSRRIRQILLNLVANAAKFTEEGTITLSAKQKAGEVLFAVIDTGPGIDSEAQKTIFEPFVQTESGIKHAGGTGLGLSISKHLAEAHGGKLWLESEPGDGAAFYVALPIGSPELVKA